MSEEEKSYLIEMAWKDRVPFELIEKEFGLSENMVKKEMRKLISGGAFRRWRKRVSGRKTKHQKVRVNRIVRNRCKKPFSDEVALKISQLSHQPSLD